MRWDIFIIAVSFVLIPALVIYGCAKNKTLGNIGDVILCYLIGIIAGNIRIFPPDIYATQEVISSACILLALPLILFSMDIKSCLRLALPTFISMLCGIIALLIVIIPGYYLLAYNLPEGWKIAGMMVGVYTGGTPNMAAIKTALEVNAETYLMVNTGDIVISLVYMLFIFTLAQRFFGLFLPSFTFNGTMDESDPQHSSQFNDMYSLLVKPQWRGLLRNTGAALIVTALSAAGGFLVSADYRMAVIILLLTFFAIAASFIPSISKVKQSFSAGMYLILVFCIVVGSMADVASITNFSAGLMLYLGISVFGSLLIHGLLARIFKIDRDTVIITSVAMILSVPFVPVAARAINNRQIILSGITVGIIGYAIGNFLGIGIAYLLR